MVVVVSVVEKGGSLMVGDVVALVVAGVNKREHRTLLAVSTFSFVLLSIRVRSQRTTKGSY